MKTPKEKAEELLSKYYLQVDTLDKQKQCALIVVDEIMKVEQAVKMNFWKAVKQEIINL
jgi:hypothetical protein